MLNDITLGQYFPGDSAIHRMDPRMKLILTILYIVGVFCVGNLPGYAIALRFIPTLLEETDKIQKAQMARGADFESGNLIARAKAMIPLLVPLFVSSFRRANELAMAMEARCYHGGDHRTRLRELKYTKLDAFGALAMAAFLAVIFAEGRLLG